MIGRQVGNIAAARALLARGGSMVTKLGLVTSYDPARGAIKVALQPNGQETGWVELGNVWSGNGWGLAIGPAVGDQAFVGFVDGDLESGVCTGFLNSDTDQPMGVPSGELWAKNEAGYSIKITKDPAIKLDTGAGASIVLSAATITSIGTWSHTGDMTASGTITGTTEVIGNGTHLHTHKHSGVTAGAAQTGTPV